jgi:outer membrane protein OmpA-like peptidoglycan-associated protein
MRNALVTASLLTLVVAVAPACATKKFVRTSVGEINGKVDTLSGTVEETQARTRVHEGRIGEVDRKAEMAGRSAAEAQSAADAAAVAAKEANAKAAAVDARASAIETAARRLLYQVTLSEDQGNFTFGKADLPDEVMARLDQVIGALKADPKGVFIEIEGHTDNVGSREFNEHLGMERAEAVKRYVYERHQVPLHRISAISYGEDKPIASNGTRDGRAQNRRVVIRVLS